MKNERTACEARQRTRERRRTAENLLVLVWLGKVRYGKTRITDDHLGGSVREGGGGNGLVR